MKASYLTETDHIDFSHPAIQNLASKITGTTQKEQVIEIYYLVRDSVRYNPYTIKAGKKSLKASFAAENGEAYCIPKAALMVALCRYFKIPARLGLADVKNHLSSQKLLDLLGSDYFAMHGYSEIYINNHWVKCTPIFNVELCEKFGVDALEFDGENDAIFQDYTLSGKKHMEYLVDHGSFDDVPVEFIYAGFQKHYPHLLHNLINLQESSLERDLDL